MPIKVSVMIVIAISSAVPSIVVAISIMIMASVESMITPVMAISTPMVAIMPVSMPVLRNGSGSAAAG